MAIYFYILLLNVVFEGSTLNFNYTTKINKVKTTFKDKQVEKIKIVNGFTYINFKE